MTGPEENSTTRASTGGSVRHRGQTRISEGLTVGYLFDEANIEAATTTTKTLMRQIRLLDGGGAAAATRAAAAIQSRPLMRLGADIGARENRTLTTGRGGRR